MLTRALAMSKRRLPLVALALQLPSIAADGLIPPECVLIYNANSNTSADLARYYASKRGVPPDHLLGIQMPIREEIDRDEYVQRIAPAVRRFLSEQAWGGTVKCLVTFYDVPLRVQAGKPSPGELQRANQFEKRFHEVCDKIEMLMAGELGTGRAPTTQPARSGRDKPEYLGELFRRYAVQRNVLRQRWRDATGDDAARRQTALVSSVGQLEGEAALLASYRPEGAPDDAARSAAIDELTAQLDQVRRRMRDILAKGTTSDDRPHAWPLIERVDGLIGLAQRLDTDVRTLRHEDMSAAFDSELALVRTESYEAHRWQPNPARPNAPGETSDKKALMVARLDAPTAALVRRMIDDAVAVEAVGLSGTVYIDARGLGTRDTYGVYDDDLRNLADLVRKKTDLELLLNNNPDLFQPGDCPKAALYCGWYSVSNYVDAFDFVPGAVAFHIASFELTSLRDSNQRYWCPELLRDGVAATLGPTSEPYLHTFPLPSEFFGLLLCGEYTLAECFQQSNPFLSWQMCLLGDPLYRPFARNPKLKVSDVFAAPAATQPAGERHDP